MSPVAHVLTIVLVAAGTYTCGYAHGVLTTLLRRDTR